MTSTKPINTIKDLLVDELGEEFCDEISEHSFDPVDHYDIENDYETNTCIYVKISCPNTNKEKNTCTCKFCDNYKKQQARYANTDKNRRYDKLMEEYSDYCISKNCPNFLGIRGYCYSCYKNNLDYWVETNKKELITGCHYCLKSYCD